jgi:hemolysin D
MESTNKPFMKRWFSFKWGKNPKAKTAVEYLPDADEIERTPVPKFAQITLRVLFAALAVFAIWASLSQLDEVIVAQGRLVNPLPNVVVQPLETSIVQSVDVRVGQVVKKGDKLASLDATFAQADETQLRAQLDSLDTQVHSLGRELDVEGSTAGAAVVGAQTADGQLQASLSSERKANYRAQQMRMAETAAKLRAALSTNRQDQQFVASRLKSLKEIELMQEKMVAQKIGAPLQLLEAQQRSKEVERDLELSRSREQEIRRELNAFDAERLAFEKSWRQKAMEDMLVLSRERDSVKEQLQKADKRRRLVTLVSPVDAVVLEIAKLSPGSIVKEAETFFTLVPLNIELEAEVHIDSVDVGYIKLGDPVHLKLDAFPFQRHGTLDGRVQSLSEDAFRKETQVKTGTDAYYLSRVSIDKVNLKNMLPNSRILPGMTLNAEIVVGKRTVMSYLAWPLTKGLGEAVREP